MPVLARVSTLPNGYISVKVPYDPTVLELFRQIPGLNFDWDTKTHVGAPEAMVEALRLLEGTKLAVVVGTPTPARKLRSPRPVVADGLFGYQSVGADFLVRTALQTGGALLADGMGLGKTVQAIRAADALAVNGGRLLVVCPAMAVPTWVTEYPIWSSRGDPIVRLDGPKTKKKAAAAERWLEEGGAAVTSFESFTARITPDMRVTTVVLDEVHYLANRKAKRTAAIKEWLDGHTHRPRILGTSGTPMTTRTRDLWQPLDIIWPGRFGSKSRFEKRYSGGKCVVIPGLDDAVWQADGATHVDELHRRLVDGGLMLRRVAEDVLELPEKRRVIYPVELPEKAVTNLRKAVALANFGDSKSVNRLLSNVEEYKVAATVSLARELRASGNKVLIYTLRKETARDIAEQLGVNYVTGEDSANERVAKLVANDIGVATLYSVTVGLNGLTYFDTGIFVGMDYVPSTLLQAEARLHRIGQQNRNLFYYVIALRTIDEVVRAKVVDRLDTFSELVGTATGERELAERLAERADEQDVIDDIVAAVLKGVI